jgi:hypothetical protein
LLIFYRSYLFFACGAVRKSTAINGFYPPPENVFPVSGKTLGSAKNIFCFFDFFLFRRLFLLTCAPIGYYSGKRERTGTDIGGYRRKMEKDRKKGRDGRSGERLYRYLLCIRFMPGRKTTKAVADEMGVAESTVYENTATLRSRGFLRKDGGEYALTEKSMWILHKIDRDTFDNLAFLLRRLGCGESAATREALASVLRGPIVPMRRIANRGASLAALFRAGTPAGKHIDSLPPGRHDADFAVNSIRPEKGGTTRIPAVFVVMDGLCALELRETHIRRIAAEAMPHGNRILPRRVLYVAGDKAAHGLVPARETAGRWHIRGNAVTGGFAEDGTLTGRVRVAVENARGERYPAEIALRFAAKTTDDAAPYDADFLPQDR